MKKVKLLSKIGSGGSDATIFAAEWLGKEVDVKIFRTRLFGDQEDFDNFEKEISIISSISHPFIIKFFGCSLSPPRVGIVMEFCKNGDLRDYLMKRRNVEKESVDMKTKTRLLYEISSAISFLSNKNIIHRDIKLKNVLIDSKITAKLIDFGLSKIMKTTFSKRTKHVGTNYFMSPEVVLGNSYDVSADVFSFALVMFVSMSENFFPYGKGNEGAIEIQVAQDPLMRPKFDECESLFPKEMKELIVKCWEHESEDRPSIDKVENSLKEILKNLST